MDPNLVIGCAVIVIALAALTVLVLWSRRRIERIAKMEHRSARRILKDLHGE